MINTQVKKMLSFYRTGTEAHILYGYLDNLNKPIPKYREYQLQDKIWVHEYYTETNLKLILENYKILKTQSTEIIIQTLDSYKCNIYSLDYSVIINQVKNDYFFVDIDFEDDTTQLNRMDLLKVCVDRGLELPGNMELQNESTSRCLSIFLEVIKNDLIAREHDKIIKSSNKPLSYEMIMRWYKLWGYNDFHPDTIQKLQELE